MKVLQLAVAALAIAIATTQGPRVDSVLVETKALATAILDSIHARRNAELLAIVDGLSTAQLQNIQNSLKTTYEKVADANVVAARDKAVGMTPDEMRSTLKDHINGLKNYDTIAVMYSKKAKYVTIAGNIQSPDLNATDLNDVQFWAGVLQVNTGDAQAHKYDAKTKDLGFQDADTPVIEKVLKEQSQGGKIRWTDNGVYIVTAERFQFPDLPEDLNIAWEVAHSLKYQLQKVAFAIQKLENKLKVGGLTQAEMTELKKLKNGEVSKRELLKQKEQEIRVSGNQQLTDKLDQLQNGQIPPQQPEGWEKKWKDITDLETRLQNGNKKIEELEAKGRARADGRLEPLERKKLSYLESERDKTKQLLDKAYRTANRAPHAERQLQILKDTNNAFNLPPDESDIRIGVSKPPCQKCFDVLDPDRSVKFTSGSEYYGGKEANSMVKGNWESKFDVKATEINLPDPNPTPNVCASSSGSRRRRSAASGGGGSGCIFWQSGKKKPKIDQIDSESFFKAYTGTKDQRVKTSMANIANENVHALAGSSADIDRVKTILEYEKMQKHSAKIDHVQDSIGSRQYPKERHPSRKFSIQDLQAGDNLKQSPTKTAEKHARMGKGMKSLNFAGQGIGYALLAKHVVQAIGNGDTTSLAIIGGTEGGELIMRGLGASSKYVLRKGTEYGAKHGTKFGIHASAKFASKGLKFLGKAAGPLGVAAGIGLSAWSIAGAVGRLTNPHATRFEQNDAIIDIVEASIDIVATITVMAASYAFPPLAPVFILIGIFVSLFASDAAARAKAHNHVDMLDSKIPLLDYERKQEFDRHMDGEQTTAYILDLIKVKQANNAMINATIQFLEKNPDVIGNVVPSKTFVVYGNCRLEKQHCRRRIGKGGKNCLAGQWEDWRTIASDCLGHDQSCAIAEDPAWSTCMTQGQIMVNEGFNIFRCPCEGEMKTELKDLHKDSIVDLREKRTIWVERASPDFKPPYQYEYLCLPSSKTDMGDRVSKRIQEFGYLCLNAMGVKRVDPSRGKYMMFDLGDGNDEIYLQATDPTANYFSVGDGVKKYYGGAGSDTFVVSGPCQELEGVLDGKGGEANVLLLNSDCAAGQQLQINLGLGGRFLANGRSNIHLAVWNMQIIYGRANEPDLITTDCGTKYVDGGGGAGAAAEALDEVHVYQTNCAYNLTIIVGSYTRTILGHQRGIVNVVVPSVESALYFKHDNIINLNSTMYMINASCHDLEKASYTNTQGSTTGNGQGHGHIVTLWIQGQQMWFRIPGAEDSSDAFPNVLLDKSHGIGVGCWLTLQDQQLVAVHRLEGVSEGAAKREQYGTPGATNIFLCINGTWDVHGAGQITNDFILTNVSEAAEFGFKGRIFGSPAAKANSLRFDQDLEGDMFVNTVRGIVWKGISLSGIQRIFGRASKREGITADCSVELVQGGGGVSQKIPDVITLVEGSEHEHDGSKFRQQESITVIASGHTKVDSLRITSCQQVFVIPAATPAASGSTILNLDLVGSGDARAQTSSFTRLEGASNNKISNVGAVIIIQVSISRLEAAAAEGMNGGFTLRLQAPQQKFILHAEYDDDEGQDDSIDLNPHWTNPEIQFQEPDGSPASRLLVAKEKNIQGRGTHGLLAFHNLQQSQSLQSQNSSPDTSGAGFIRNCSSLMPNYISWSSGKYRINCRGGDHANGTNVFHILGPGPVTGSIWATAKYGSGSGGGNILHLDDQISSRSIDIDLEEGTLEFEGESTVLLAGIDIVQGRKGKTDNIEIGCTTRQVSLQGGSEKAPDYVHVMSSCEDEKQQQKNPIFMPLPPLLIFATGYTALQKSRAHNRKIEVHVLEEASASEEPAPGFRFGAAFHANNMTLVFHTEVGYLTEYQHSFNAKYGLNGLYNISIKLGLEGRTSISKAQLAITVGGTSKETENHTGKGMYYLQEPQITFIDKDGGHAGALLIRKSDGAGLAFHILDSRARNHSTHRYHQYAGSSAIPNLFHLIAGAWVLRGGGGNHSDTFVQISEEFSGTIVGRAASNANTFIVDEKLPATSTVDINLDKKVIRIRTRKGASSLVPAKGSINVSGIQIIRGRRAAPELITATCGTIQIDGQGSNNVHHPDVVTIPANCSADRSPSPLLSIIVSEHTIVENLASSGEFIYIIDQDKHFDISTVALVSVDNASGSTAKHSYQFNLPLDKIHAMALEFEASAESTTTTLRMELTSGKSMSFQMSDSNNGNGSDTFQNPRIQFSQKEANINIVTDIHVQHGEVFSTIKVEDSGPDPDSPDPAADAIRTAMEVTGINGIANDFLISTSRSLDLVHGSTKDDSFWISGVGTIEVLDGGGEAGNGNSVNLLDTWRAGEEIMVDLVGGSITATAAKIEAEDADADTDSESDREEKQLIKKMRRIQIVRGRAQGYDIVYPACDTKQVWNADEIWFNDMNCTNYKIGMVLGQHTKVGFNASPSNEDTDSDTGLEGSYAPGGTFVYEFQQPRTFSIDTDFWYRIRESRHIFRFAFQISELETIWYDASLSSLAYKISNRTYAHWVDRYIEAEDQYYAQPMFVSLDGFQIRVARDGSLFITGTTISETGKQPLDPSMVVLQFVAMAKRLKVNFIVHLGTEFMYVGYSGGQMKDSATGECVESRSPNLLTNFEGKKSHLAGGGGLGSCDGGTATNTMYTILSLANDVHVYPILSESSHQEKQLIDLTEIVWEIRNRTGGKYIPTLAETMDGHLEINMQGYEVEYPGRVIIMNGTGLALRLQFLLNAVAMVAMVEDVSEDSDKESMNDRVWKLKPVPIEIPAGHIFVLSAGDLEYGQQITVGNGMDIELGSNETNFQMVRKDNDVVLTNMETEAGKGDIEQVSSLVFLNFYDDHGEMTTNDRLQDVTIAIAMDADGATIRINFTDPNAVQLVKDWEDLLEAAEELLLESLPEMGRQFALPVWKRAWKSYRVWSIAILACVVASCAAAIYHVTQWGFSGLHVDMNVKRAQIRSRNFRTYNHDKVPYSAGAGDGYESDEHGHEMQMLKSSSGVNHD